MSNIGKTIGLCIDLIHEDLNRFRAAQIDCDQAFGAVEARTIKDYLQALSTAFRAAGQVNFETDVGLEDISIEEIENELLSRLKVSQK